MSKKYSAITIGVFLVSVLGVLIYWSYFELKRPVVLTSSTAQNTQQLVGKWQIVNSSGSNGGSTADTNKLEYTFRPDGTFALTRNGALQHNNESIIAPATATSSGAWTIVDTQKTPTVVMPNGKDVLHLQGSRL